MKALPAYLAYLAILLLCYDATSVYRLEPYDPGPRKDILGNPIDPALEDFIPIVKFEPFKDGTADRGESSENCSRPKPEEYTGEWIPLNDRQSAIIARAEETGIVLTLQKNRGRLPRLILKAEDPKLEYETFAKSAKVMVSPTSVQSADGPVICWIQVMDTAGKVVFAGTVEVYGVIYPNPSSRSAPAPAAAPIPAPASAQPDKPSQQIKQAPRKEKRSGEPDGIRAVV